jgi:O-antigen ligase
MRERQRRWLVSTGALVAILLPLVFNPYAAAPFEPSKVLLVRITAVVMSSVALLPAIVDRFRRPRSPVSGSEGARETGASEGWLSNPLAIPVLIYATVLLLATLFSIDFEASLWGIETQHGLVTTFAVLLLFGLLAAALRQWEQIQLIVTALIVGSVPVALYGWVQYLGLDALSWITMSISPVHSTLGRSVFLGAYLAMIAPFTLARIVTPLRPGRKARITHLLILVLQLGCLVFTLARAAWLGFLGGALLYGCLMSRRRRKWIAGLALLATAGTLVFGLIALYGGNLFFETAGIPSQEQFATLRRNSNSARTTTWRNALDLVVDRWPLGYGPETFLIASERRGFARDSNLPSWLFLDDPHNVFLYQLTSAGVAGFLAFIFIILRFYRLGLSCLIGNLQGDQRATLAVLLGSSSAYLIQAQLTPDVVTVSAIFWMTLALGVAAVRVIGTHEGDRT